MAIGDHAYTRVIRGLKITLPLVALALLSAMFLLSKKVEPTAAIALSDRAFRAKIDRSQLSNPNYDGTTGNGESMNVTAQSARPDPEIEGKAYGQLVNAVLLHLPGEQLVNTVSVNSPIGHWVKEG